MVTATPLLELENVSFRYDDARQLALAEVSLAVRPGRFLGLLGPNGSGKSTALRLAAGLLRPGEGSVRLRGTDLGRVPRDEIARTVAVVPQGDRLPDAYTGWEVAMAGRSPHRPWWRSPSASDRGIVRRALSLVAALPLADRRIGALSGGERQRLVLARALAQEPDVLLLDEPTAHLDVAHQVAFVQLVHQLVRSDELAVLGVFHDVNLAAEYCDDIVLLREGRVLAHGEPATLLGPAVIEAVYGAPLPTVAHPESGRPAFLPPSPTGTVRVGTLHPDSAVVQADAMTTGGER